jgi:hypothetical protein
MKKIALVLIAFALVSCQKKNETPETLSPELASYEQESASDSSNVTSTQNSAPITMNNSAPVAPQSNTVSINQPQPTAPGMNPPHGQPNHRCDIPVGAPLNSKKAEPTTVKTTDIQTTTTAPIAAQQNNAGSTSVAAGMNPAHGQPGHRCDIPVGAPLPTN